MQYSVINFCHSNLFDIIQHCVCMGVFVHVSIMEIRYDHK